MLRDNQKVVSCLLGEYCNVINWFICKHPSFHIFVENEEKVLRDFIFVSESLLLPLSSFLSTLRVFELSEWLVGVKGKKNWKSWKDIYNFLNGFQTFNTMMERIILNNASCMWPSRAREESLLQQRKRIRKQKTHQIRIVVSHYLWVPIPENILRRFRTIPDNASKVQIVSFL